MSPSAFRLTVLFVVGAAVAGVLAVVGPWQLALLGGWIAASIVYLIATWSVIGRADGAETERTSTVEDDSRATRGLIIVTASVVSLPGAALALKEATESDGGSQTALLTIAAIAAVVVSWFAVHTDFTLRYAHALLHPARWRARVRRRRPARLSRLRLRRVHRRDVLPDLRHGDADGALPPHAAASCPVVVPLRRRHRGRRHQRRRRAGELNCSNLAKSGAPCSALPRRRLVFAPGTSLEVRTGWGPCRGLMEGWVGEVPAQATDQLHDHVLRRRDARVLPRRQPAQPAAALRHHQPEPRLGQHQRLADRQEPQPVRADCSAATGTG